jgi:hypothetical protein
MDGDAHRRLANDVQTEHGSLVGLANTERIKRLRATDAAARCASKQPITPRVLVTQEANKELR